MIGHEGLLQLAEEDRGKAVRRVYIPAQEEHQGMHGLTVAVPWICPVCDGVRGEPTPGLSYDGSRRLGVHTWINPCGHVDKFMAVRAEARQHQLETEAAERELDEAPEEDPTPCPFCGESATETHTDGFKDKHPACVVVCGACGARGPRREATTVREAARHARTAWSATPRKQQAYLAEAEAARTQLTSEVARLQAELAKQRPLFGSVYLVAGCIGWETGEAIAGLTSEKAAKAVAASARELSKAIPVTWKRMKDTGLLDSPRDEEPKEATEEAPEDPLDDGDTSYDRDKDDALTEGPCN